MFLFEFFSWPNNFAHVIDKCYCEQYVGSCEISPDDGEFANTRF